MIATVKTVEGTDITVYAPSRLDPKEEVVLSIEIGAPGLPSVLPGLTKANARILAAALLEAAK